MQPDLDGQNSSPPSQKLFLWHAFVAHTTSGTVLYYDPSYGVTYNDEQDFQNKAVAAFAPRNTPFVFDGKNRYLLTKPDPSILRIKFNTTP
jgi:hypothetical protein